jgi:hypothetical protein
LTAGGVAWGVEHQGEKGNWSKKARNGHLRKQKKETRDSSGTPKIYETHIHNKIKTKKWILL